MPVTLTLSTRAAVIAALPTAPDDATDEDLVRGLASAAADLRAELDAARNLTPTAREPAPGQAAAAAALDDLLSLASGDEVPDTAFADARVRRLADAVIALRRRADESAHALAEARQALVGAEGRGYERANAAYTRALRRAAAEGRVPDDDLPPGPVRELASEVARLRTAAEAARADLVDADKLRAAAEAKLLEHVTRAAEARRAGGTVDREHRHQLAEMEKKAKAAELAPRPRDRAGSQG